MNGQIPPNTQPGAGYWAAPIYPPQPQHYAPPTQTPQTPARSGRFLQGLLVGGIAAYLLSNEAFQQSAIRAAVKTWSSVQGGVEEMKERFRDAEAELHAAHEED